MKNKLWLCILIMCVVVPPIVNFIVSMPSPLGFISPDRQETWIDFYGALIGGVLTLMGVSWTIKYTETIRTDDQKNHEQEIAEEFKRRDIETKDILSAQYKPILTIFFDADYIDGIKWDMPKYESFFLQNTISLVDKQNFEQDTKRLVISLTVLNIGRGEASDLTIHSSVISSEGEEWETITREYKEISASNGINIMFYKTITENEWEQYKDNMLGKQLHIVIKIDYSDLVGYRHSLQSNISINRFICMRDKDKHIISNVLVLNPYDSKIQNETYDERKL